MRSVCYRTGASGILYPIGTIKETAMMTCRQVKHLTALALAAVFATASTTALAAPPQSSAPAGRPGWGYGMGPGMMGGYGGGYGMGPGMMGGYNGGSGMGPGMMGGYGWEPGLGLSAEQQAKINRIQDETRHAHWTLMGSMMDQRAKLRDLYAAPKRDQSAIDEANKTLGKMQRQMYDSSVAARKRIDAVLTKEQRDKLRSYWESSAGW